MLNVKAFIYKYYPTFISTNRNSFEFLADTFKILMMVEYGP